ncbi:rod shape-determining protein MreC [Salinispirillum marinum]|uniref:Cell shape-determining protein MreC n=2 Tax=Saccharospirillaceae TaxID=255527 RepID=A0ABV8BG00_9GAMM
MSNSLFHTKRYYGTRLVIFFLFAMALLVADWQFAQMNYVRQVFSVGFTPVRWLVNIPSSVSEWSSRNLVARSTLLEENARLRAQLFVLERRAQRMILLETENDRLRLLLNASEQLEDRFISAELIGVDPDPFSHQVILNRGLSSGAYIGQPVIDANGLVGQIIQADQLTSRVLLIGDVNHAVPVQVNRNGVRTTVVGTGDLGRMELLFVPETADIVVGDLLITSGLGQRFPVGYPVAEVTEVRRDPGTTFATISARPLAELDRTRHVLLVDTQRSVESDSVTAPAPEEQ